MSQVRLNLFGAPRLEKDGQPIKIETWKAFALLAYLALNQQDHNREALATLFWPEQGETQARGSLRRALWTLRQALHDDAINGDKQTVGLQLSAGWVVDVLQFQRLVTVAGASTDTITEEQLEQLRSAVTLYQADFLAGFTLPDCPAFDEWQFFTAERLRRTLADILQRLIEWDMAQQNYPTAIEAARRWVALDGLHEPAHRRLMQLYAWSGQQAAALRQYEECKRLLAQELDVPPEDETTQLFTAIRKNQLAPATLKRTTALATTGAAPIPPPRHNLPHPSIPIVGRALDLAELDLLMFDRHERLITITGPGGMGKTRLALAVAERHLAANRFLDGVWFLPLAAVDDAQAIIPALATALALTTTGNKSGEEARKQQVLDFLRDKQLLLIFDNFEQVQDGRALLNEILAAAPAVHLVVTSRERLHLRDEQVYPISGLECPTTAIDVETPAVVLFLRLARRVQPHFQPSATEQHDLVRICQLTGGMPLALELAAGWVQLLPLSAIVAAIQTNLDLLETTAHDIPARHRSVRAAFDTTWALLTIEEREQFAQLSVFRGGFTRAAAQQVANVTLKQLAHFISKSLVDYQRETDRYILHELLRQYAAEKLDEYGEKDAIHRRHLHYFLTLAETMATPPGGRPEEKLLAVFDCEKDNFRAALTWGFATPTAPPSVITSAAWLAIRLEHFWDLRQYWQEGRDWFSKALAMLPMPSTHVQQPTATAERCTSELKATLLLHAGRFANNFIVAQTLLEESLSHCQTLGDIRLTAQCLYELGATVVNRGDYRRARSLYTESLTYARQLDEQPFMAYVLVRLANLMLEENDVEQATKLTEESLALFRHQQDSSGVRITQITLAQCHLARGNFAQTSTLLQEVLASARLVNPQSKGGPWTYRVLGLAEQMQGHYAQASDYYQRSLLLRQEQQDVSGMAWALEGLVEVAAATAQPLRAAHLAGAAARLRQQSGSTISIDEQPRYELALRNVGMVLGEASFQDAWTVGAVLPLEQLVAYVVAGNTLP